jgi:prepilin-type N-terminal cleavage/methylation domain-containing protein
MPADEMMVSYLFPAALLEVRNPDRKAAMRTARRRQLGFSVMELVIVVAVIALIAAIALPYLFRARQHAQAASAAASLNAINLAQQSYQNSYPAVGYSAGLSNLGSNGSTCETTSPTNACLLDPVLAGGIKSGYIFDLVGDGHTPDMEYTVTATPESAATGKCSYTSNQTGAIAAGLPPSQGRFSITPSTGGGGCGI